MKYEQVFGDQGLFDGMMPDCEFIVGTYGYKIKDGKCFYCEKYNHKYGWSPTGDAVKALSPVIAMRRIIKEPKRWTAEDQKAGLLPDVGCEYIGRDVLLTCVFVDKNRDVWGKSKDNLMYCHDYSEIKPLETPEEKERRARKEWCNRAMDYSTIQELYDAILSGELTMPSKDGE